MLKFRVSLLSLALLLGASVAVPAIAKTPAVTTAAAQPQIASGSAMIVDLNTNQVIYASHPDLVRPIASITKLMTAMVVLDAHLPLDEKLKVDISHTPEMKGIYSRVRLNSEISRKNMLLLALMSSENRAAHSLARTYPGGTSAFVAAMNRKARSLGMNHTVFYDPTGLNKDNTSTAADLALMVQAAYRYPQIRQFTTSTDHDIISASGRQLHYKNSNALVREGVWDIQLSKTGYIKEAGRCLVMVAEVQSKPMVMVFLDAGATSGRISDARNIKTWLERQPTNQLG